MTLSIDEVVTLRECTDIVKLIGARTALHDMGKAGILGTCPFTGCGSKLFAVEPRRQLFLCHKCDRKGDAFSFLMQLDDLSFDRACLRLAMNALASRATP